MNSKTILSRTAFHRASVLIKTSPYQLRTHKKIGHRLLATSQSNKQSDFELTLLDHALTKVPEHGWTKAALAQAANDLGYSSAAHGIAEPITLISHFMDRALDNTLVEVDDQLHELPSEHQQLRLICRTRLRQTLPLVKRWPEAAAILAQPKNLPLAMSQLARMSSEFWYLTGDQATRINWYAKRSGLAAAYLASEMYMCEDGSPEHCDTWAFLDRRLEELMEMQVAGTKTLDFANQFTRNFYNILASRGFISRN
ncbi:Ubiquinone biosynthesis protein coq9, mitochondrial [Coemansia erecta]|uniref:Ubiquinone biosynthesis protein n=1 Tax=Coemansia asiatica TaxID=1052880 RepID=A0A9W7XNT5_9FUNG|nr:Ubiquinone biosynthesis protein coq9, mitochondrial [Coemansia asiatica]KAJ2846208.1 Ubiquinone biosynthesis protein coq9, mitochondrial [Coemansia erecta]KAJ2873225.1 Ubiquinone biosynthesis protein coq9, mitochondrial [Coemansia asiatica]